MKVTNITNLTVKPLTVSIMVRIKNKDERFELKPGESIYSNGDFNALFNKSLRVQKQKGLISVIDENDLAQMAKDEQEEIELVLEQERLKKTAELKKQEEENQTAKKKKSAFDNPDLFEEPRPHHPDLIIINKKEVDYSENVIPEPEDTNTKQKKSFLFKKKE